MPNQLDDLFEQMSALFSADALNTLDVRMDLALFAMDAENGCRRAVQVERKKLCSTCGGTAAAPDSQTERCAKCGGKGTITTSTSPFQITHHCDACRGLGRIVDRACADCIEGTRTQVESLTVTVPPECTHGMTLRLRGRGHERFQRPTGDCYVRLVVVAHPITERRDADFVVQVPLARDVARSGGSIDVPTRDGTVRVTIPKRARDGDEIVLQGRGFARADSGADLPRGESYRSGVPHGDQIVRWRVPPSAFGSLSPQTIAAVGIVTVGAAIAAGIARC
jgi:molecular chaperone DnaJ